MEGDRNRQEEERGRRGKRRGWGEIRRRRKREGGDAGYGCSKGSAAAAGKSWRPSRNYLAALRQRERESVCEREEREIGIKTCFGMCFSFAKSIRKHALDHERQRTIFSILKFPLFFKQTNNQRKREKENERNWVLFWVLLLIQ